jgi:hypothetical protein
LEVIVWLALLAYTIYDWQTARTGWLPWAFAVLTILYGVWLFPRVARSMARRYLQELVVALRDRHVAPATGDEVARVLAQCLLSPTGRHLMTGLKTAGTEPDNVLYTPEAISVLTAFVAAKQTIGDGIELDANTLRWLKSPKFSWARLREHWAGPRR